MNERNPYSPCPYVCGNKSSSGWCATTACINPEHNGSNITFSINEANYTVRRTCPKCGRPFTEDMVCKCGENNANIRL